MDPRLDNPMPKLLKRLMIVLALGGGFTIYIMLASFMTVVFPPPLGFAMVAPFLPLILWVAPESKPIPRSLTRVVLYLGIALMPIWPVYLHVQLGPTPILTPTRAMFYALSGIWLYEMACVSWRRKQFLVAVRRLPIVFWLITALFILKILSVPMAEGKAIAIKETFRQIMIWYIPFLAVLTYVQRRKYLDFVITLVVIASSGVALIALGEYATQTALAEKLSPIIGHQEWLTNITEAKIRDGVFRSQATHTHPLSMGEHLSMVMPLAMYKVYRKGAFWPRVFFAGIVFLLVAASLLANSRGALIGGVIAFCLTGFMMAQAWIRKPEALAFRPLIGMIFAGALLFSPVAGIAAWKLTTGEEGTQAARSTEGRMEQIEFAWPKMLERPVLGWGTGRSVQILGWWGGVASIDNYYLNLGLELGFPGPLLYLATFMVIAGIGFRRGLKDIYDPYSGLWFAYCGFAVCFMITRSILSITTNVELFMVLAAALVGSSKIRPRINNRRRFKTFGPKPVMSVDDLEAWRKDVLTGQTHMATSTAHRIR